MRLIDADELERVFVGKHYGVNVIKYFIKMQPTIDAVPVEHGRWEVIDEAEPQRYGCSICKRLSWHETNYCSYCGAKMSEVRE